MPITLRLSSAALIGLIFLCVAWELKIAPLRPGGSWLVLKVIPLLFPLRGILHGRRYTYQWSALLACVYLCEGLVRSWTDTGMSRWMALAEIALSSILLGSASLYARATRPDLEQTLHHEGH